MVKAYELLDQDAVKSLFVKGTSLDLLKTVATGLVKEIASLKGPIAKGEAWAVAKLGEIKARLGQLKQEADNYIKANTWEGIGPVGKMALAATWGSQKLHEKAGETGGWAGIGLKILAQINPGNMIMGSWGSLTGGEKVTMGRKLLAGANIALNTLATGFTYANPTLLGIQAGMILSQEAAYAGCIKAGMSPEKAAVARDAIGSIGFLMVMSSWKSNAVQEAKAAGGLIAGVKAVVKDMGTKNYVARLAAFYGIEKVAGGLAWGVNKSLGGDKYSENVIKGTIFGVAFKFGAKPAQKLVENWIKGNEVKINALEKSQTEGYRSPAGDGPR